MQPIAADPYRLPFAADHYQLLDKPAALIPGRGGVVFDPSPVTVPWTELLTKGKRISERQFLMLLYALE